MKKTLLLFFTSAVLAVGVQAQTNADNTGKNARDSDGGTLTATDQSNDPADLKMVAAIRKMVVADDSLSMLAKNVKIIVVGGVVTLRGPVETAKEKATIAAHAKHVGPKSVVDEIEIKTP